MYFHVFDIIFDFAACWGCCKGSWSGLLNVHAGLCACIFDLARMWSYVIVNVCIWPRLQAKGEGEMRTRHISAGGPFVGDNLSAHSKNFMSVLYIDKVYCAREGRKCHHLTGSPLGGDVFSVCRGCNK